MASLLTVSRNVIAEKQEMIDSLEEDKRAVCCRIAATTAELDKVVNLMLILLFLLLLVG